MTDATNQVHVRAATTIWYSYGCARTLYDIYFEVCTLPPEIYVVSTDPQVGAAFINRRIQSALRRCDIDGPQSGTSYV